MKILLSCCRQTLTLALMLLLSVCFLFFIHFCHSATLSLATQPLTREWHDKEEAATNAKVAAAEPWNKASNKDDHFSGLLWFVHLTDLHISKFWSPERVEDLEQFCLFMRDGIKPAVAVVTGDLTDAKTADRVGSTQYQEEWETYKSLWRNYCRIKPTTVDATAGDGGSNTNSSSLPLWLDIRGNHDTFNVKSDEANNNFFLRYGVQGKTEKRSYLKTLEHNGGKFAFVGIDATLSPGPKRPFNFFGSLSPDQMTRAQELLARGQAYNDAGLVVFGHYPLSTVISPHPGIKQLVGDAGASVYLSGHLHNLLELAPKMYTKQPEGYLDLELADWKDHRMFRLAALDRGHLSFTDQKFKVAAGGGKKVTTKAIVLITNPLDAQYMYGPRIKHGFRTMSNSTHIRALVFAQRAARKVTVQIDGDKETLEMTRVKEDGPLYVARWSPLKYDDGKLHNVTVKAVFGDETLEEDIEEVVDERQFTLSIEGLDQVEDFGVLQRFILMSNISMILQAGFAVALAFILLPMCGFRLAHKMALEDRLRRPRRPKAALPRLLFNAVKGFWMVSNLNQIFYPVLAYLALVAFGPWGVGYFLEDEIGVVFSWGMFISGTWLPCYTTLIYSYWFMVPYWYIMLAGITWTVSMKYEEMTSSPGDDDAIKFPDSFAAYFCRHLWFVLIMLLQCIHILEFYLAYGLLALVSICGLFRLVAFYWLWSAAVGLHYQDFVDSGITAIWLNHQAKKS